MGKAALAFSIFLCVLVAACSNSELLYNIETYETFELDEGMVLVHASGRKAVLGTDDKKALPTVRPSMDVAFTYDFYIGKREVTYAEYGDVLGIDYDKELLDKPVVNVTFFDAVLYANALSKKNGLDTVYTYTDASFDVAGNCVSMLDFATHYDVDAFRLPTEAEWTFVARKHWKETCTDTSAKPCDFVGGVKEWVNDWLGGFLKVTYENYVGANGDGFAKTRVLKGGSFRDDPADVHVYDRTDIYPVTADLSTNYIGFRLVYGAIPNPTFTDNAGFAVQDDIKVTISAGEFRALFGTLRGKLVFRNEASGNLMYVDFISGNPVLHEFVDTMDVYHPSISLDGRYVAFCTMPEGAPGKSETYARPLDMTTNLIKRIRAPSASIPRWRVLDNGDTAIVYVDYSGNNKNETAFRSAATWQVSFSNAIFRDDKKITDGAYHGGVSGDDRFAVTGARQLRAKRAKEGKTLLETTEDEVWYGGEQACNASLSLDGKKQTLFLDFGGKTGKDFVGKAYGTHEMLLVVDSLGNLVRGIPSPSGYTFDHTEWIRRDEMAVASLVDKNGAHSKIVVINLKDSSLTYLVEGSDITYPDLWIDELPGTGESALSPDSAGAYMMPGGSSEMTLYRYKLELLWQYRDSADVVVLGSSRPLQGVDPMALKHFFAVNLAQTPNSIAVTRDLFERYVLGNFPKLRYLVVSLDIDFWWKDSTQDNFFYERYKLYPGFVYDENHNYWKDDRDARILEYTKAAVGSETGDFIKFRRGLWVDDGLGWNDKPTFLEDSTWIYEYPELFDANVGILEDIVKLAGENGIEVVGAIFPQNPAYAKTGAFGRYGITRSEAPKRIAQIAELEKKYPNFHLMDENKMGEHDYTTTMSSNDDHLSRYGSRIFSLRLDSLLTQIESK